MREGDYAVELAESIDALAELNRSILVKIAGDMKYQAVSYALCCAANYMSAALLKTYIIANEEAIHENAE